MTPKDKPIIGVRRKLQIHKGAKQYYDNHKDEIKLIRQEYYKLHKDEIKAKNEEKKANEQVDYTIDRKAYQHWYYKNIRKKAKKDSEYKHCKDDIIKSFTFKVVVSRAPSDLILYL